MKKLIPLMFVFLLVGIGGVVGYQTLNSETLEPTRAMLDEQSVKSSTSADFVAPASPAPASLAQAEMSTPSLKAQVSSDSQVSTSLPDIDESYAPQPPRQASDISRAPSSAPSAGQDYAHHPRPGTVQPISAPVSKSPQQPIN